MKKSPNKPTVSAVYIGEKMSKVISNVIDLDEVERLMERRHQINKINVMDAIFVSKNKEVEVSREDRKHWKFTGLNTIDFAYSLYIGD